MKQYIRTLQKNDKDYTELARLFNAFKKAGNFPGGFGGNVTFNKEIISDMFENKDVSSHFIITAPDDSSRIVGVCFSCKSFNNPHAWFVDFLGVETEYQGKKLGKALLLHTTEYAKEHQLQFLALGTWPGNIKAMPLYKRQGYKWRPGTEVLMENYIPPILNYPMFKEFFADSNWYEIYRPHIDQLENREFKDEMAVYTYDFIKNENNRLKVIIDRTIGKICGFTLVGNSMDFTAEVYIDNMHCFSGMEKIPVTLSLTNNCNLNREISLDCTHSPGITLTGRKKASFSLPGGAHETITLYAELSHTIDPFDLERKPWNYSETEICFLLKSSSIDFSLYAGIVPLRAFDIKKISDVYSLNAGITSLVTLNLINRRKKEQELIIQVTGDEYVQPQNTIINIKAHELDSSIELPVSVKECSTRICQLEIIIRNKEDRILLEKKVPFPVFCKPKAVTYILDNWLYIENSELMLYIYTKPDYISNNIFICDKKRRHGTRGCIPFLGYPIIMQGSEFLTKEFTHKICRTDEGILLKSSAASEEKQGITVTREVFIPDSGQRCKVQVYLSNNSHNEIKNLGIALNSIFLFDSNSLIENRLLPLIRGITASFIPEIEPEIGKKPEEYAEGWIAAQLLRGYIGFIFDKKKPEKIFSGINYFGIQKRIGSLGPGESSDPAMFYICFTSSWHQIRQAWRELYANNFHGHHIEVSSVIGNTVIGICRTNDCKVPYRCLYLDRRENMIHLLFQLVHKAGLRGVINLDFDDMKVTPDKFDLPEEEQKRWTAQAALKDEPLKRIINGRLTYDSTGRIYKFPIHLVFYNSDKEIHISRGTSEKFSYIEVDNGYLRFKGSKEFAGSLFHLSLKDDPENYLFSYFPVLKPFCWDNKFIGGIYPRIFKPGTWQKIGCDDIHFNDRIIESGLWKGFGFVSDILQKPPGLRGFQVSVDYLTLPDAPFILVCMELANYSKATRKCEAQVSCFHNTSGTCEDRIYIPGREGIEIYRTRDNLVTIENRVERLYSVFKAKNKKHMLGQVLCRQTENELTLFYALNLSICESSVYYQNNVLAGGQKKTFYSLILAGDKVDDFAASACSNVLELLQGIPPE